jgi:hypothetical protein
MYIKKVSTANDQNDVCLENRDCRAVLASHVSKLLFSEVACSYPTFHGPSSLAKPHVSFPTDRIMNVAIPISSINNRSCGPQIRVLDLAA